MSGRRVAFDTTVAALDVAGTGRYVRCLADALSPLLGERLLPIRSRFAAPHDGPRTVAAMGRTLARDLWWHQLGVERAAEDAGAALLHLPALVGPVWGRVPTVVTIHDLSVLHSPQDFRPWFRHYARFVVPRLARRAEKVIVDSEATRLDVLDALGLAGDSVVTVPCGLAAVSRQPSEGGRQPSDGGRQPSDGGRQPSAVSRQWELQLPARFVLAVGTLEPRKNLVRLFEAIRRLSLEAETMDIVLLHAGSYGWKADDILRAAAAPELGGRVRLLGRQSDAELAELYGRATLLAFPSLFEGFGFPVLEAMAAGCPVVTSDRSSLPEVAGDAAVLVDPTSVDAMADGIRRVWTDDALASDLRRRGTERAKLFSWERTARLTADVYESVLA